MPVALCSITLIGLAAWIIVHRESFHRLVPYLLLAFFFLLGGIHATLSLQAPQSTNDISRLASKRQEASLVGILVRAPAIGPERTSLLMQVHQFLDGKEQKEASGLVQLSMADLPPPGLTPGDFFMARAHIGPVPSYGVPGAFNYQEHLAYQGIWASGWIRSQGMIMEIDRLPPPAWTEEIRFLPQAIRYRLSRFLAISLPPQTAGVYQAILLGEQANLSPQVREAFKDSGSYHILSISGLHMALLSFCVTLLLSWLLKRSEWVLLHLPATKFAALLSLLPLTAYAMIAGFDPPVVRSLIMVAVFIVALMVDRQWSIGNNIAIAALLLLATNPSLLFMASFQLTFAAVASIAVFAPDVARLVEHKKPTTDKRTMAWVWSGLRRWGLASLLVSLAATLGTTPILARQFSQVSLYGPLSTLLIEPLLCLWALMLGLAACLLIAIPPLAHLLLVLGSPGITASVAIADLFARLPFSVIRLPPPSLPAIVAWYGLILLWIYRRKFSRRQTGIGVIAGLSFLASELLPALKFNQDTVITVLDVGQGSAMVIEMPDNEAILVDGGRMQSSSRSGFNVGEDLIAPFLWERRIRRLAAVVCTHPDADHYNGIPFILQQFNPRTLWVNGYESNEEGYRALLSMAEDRGIATKIPQPGTTLYQAEGATLTVLAGGQWPGITDPHPANQDGKPNSNNQSLVLLLRHGQNSFLFPSDIETETEQALLPQLFRTDVLVAPHHGSITSSSEAFVAATSPHYVAISAGQNQTGHFPAPETIASYRKSGSTILTTSEHGSIFFHSNGRGIRVQTFR